MTHSIDIICIVPGIVTNTTAKSHCNGKLFSEFGRITIGIIAYCIDSCFTISTITTRDNHAGKVFVEAEATTATVVHHLMEAVHTIFIIVNERWIGISSRTTILTHPDTTFTIKLYLRTIMVDNSVSSITVIGTITIKPFLSRCSRPISLVSPRILVATEGFLVSTCVGLSSRQHQNTEIRAAALYIKAHVRSCNIVTIRGHKIRRSSINITISKCRTPTVKCGIHKPHHFTAPRVTTVE